MKKKQGSSPGIRIQVNKQGEGVSPGTEIPIPDKDTAFDLLKGICTALDMSGF